MVAPWMELLGPVTAETNPLEMAVVIAFSTAVRAVSAEFCEAWEVTCWLLFVVVPLACVKLIAAKLSVNQVSSCRSSILEAILYLQMCVGGRGRRANCACEQRHEPLFDAS